MQKRAAVRKWTPAVVFSNASSRMGVNACIMFKIYTCILPRMIVKHQQQSTMP